MGSRNATPEDFAKVGRLMAEGKITADMMLTHRYPFATLAETYERDVINNRELIKGVITSDKARLLKLPCSVREVLGAVFVS